MCLAMVSSILRFERGVSEVNTSGMHVVYILRFYSRGYWSPLSSGRDVAANEQRPTSENSCRVYEVSQLPLLILYIPDESE